MVEYLKSKKGYFYKLKKNGEKKRISQEEYNKKTKQKKMIGGDAIVQEDIKYKDNDICILKPEIKKGILITTPFNQVVGEDDIRTHGLHIGVNDKRSSIYFKAPYYSPDTINYTSVDSEIFSSYNNDILYGSKIYIRVDPDNTYVYSTEIRTHYMNEPQDVITRELRKSRKSLTLYLNILKTNKQIQNSDFICYNLITSLRENYSSTPNKPIIYPLTKHNIEKNSEIPIKLKWLLPEYFIFYP